MSQTTTIPQAVYDQYHACYNNQTYRAFSRMLATALGIDEPLTTYHQRAFDRCLRCRRDMT
jgi:hypothetical protein